MLQKSFDDQVVIYEENKPCHAVFLLLSGEVVLSQSQSSKISHVPTGYLFGTEFFLKKKNYEQSAKAQGIVTCLSIENEELIQSFKIDHPHFHAIFNLFTYIHNLLIQEQSS